MTVVVAVTIILAILLESSSSSKSLLAGGEKEYKLSAKVWALDVNDSQTKAKRTTTTTTPQQPNSEAPWHHRRLHETIHANWMEWMSGRSPNSFTVNRSTQDQNQTTTTNVRGKESGDHQNDHSRHDCQQEPDNLECIHNQLNVEFAQRIHTLTLRAIREVQLTNQQLQDQQHEQQQQPQQQDDNHSLSSLSLSSTPLWLTTATTIGTNSNTFATVPIIQQQQQHQNQYEYQPRRRRYLPATTYGADPTGQKDSTDAFERLVHDLLTSCHVRNDGTRTTGKSSSSSSSKNSKNSTKCPTMASGIIDLGGSMIDLEGGSYLLSSPIYIPPFYGNVQIANGVLRANNDNNSANKDNNNNNNTMTHHTMEPWWLIEIGNLTQCLDAERRQHDGQKSCHEFINLHHLLLDANNVAAGGIQVSAAMGVTIDTVFVIHFPTVGIQINQGHEVMISNSWLAQWYWSSVFEQHSSTGIGAYSASTKSDSTNTHTVHRTHGIQCHDQTSIGIQINGMDHYITNTIVFHCTKIGVQINGGANLLVGVHTWNGGGVGIQITDQSHQNRLIGCYLDYNSLDIYTPIKRLIVEFGFFLQTGIRLIDHQHDDEDDDDGAGDDHDHHHRNNVIPSSMGASRAVSQSPSVKIKRSRSTSQSPTTTTTKNNDRLKIDGLALRSNSYAVWSGKVAIDVIGNFTSDSIRNVQVLDDFYSNKSTKVSMSLELRNATSWIFDFHDRLLFPFIDRVVSYTVVPSLVVENENDYYTVPQPFFQHMLRPLRGTIVEVITSVPISATVHMTVEQG